MLAISLFVYLACDKPMQPFEVPQGKESKSLILIFERMPHITDTCEFVVGSGYGKTFEPEVVYYDNFRKKEFVINKINPKDTVAIFPVSNYAIVRHRYDAFNYYEFLFQRGDTVVFSYNSNHRPLPKVLNRKTLPYDFIYDEKVRRRFIQPRHTPVFKYTDARSFTDFSIDLSKDPIDSQEKKIKDKAYKESMLLFKHENVFLDSLLANNSISKEVYDFYKNRIINMSLVLNINENKIPYERIEIITRKDSSASTVFPNMYYHLFLEAAADKYFVENATKINFKDGVNRDYKEIYKSINAASMFTENSKNFLLTREINRIAKSFSKDDFKEYFGFYEKDIKDTAMINSIRNENFLELNTVKSESNTLILMSGDKKQLTLDDMIKANYGKVVMLDFWASWCAPCRVAMPYSIKLHDQLKGTGVVFVYLSIDKNLGAWERASLKEGLIEVKENYIILNFETSDFTKQHKIGLIPRYMIFDKKGRIAYANAMSPESKDLKDILLKLALK